MTVSSAVSANGSGNVLLNVLGTGASLSSSANVMSGSGNVSLLAAQDVTFTGGGISTVNGTINVHAVAGDLSLAGTASNHTAGSGDIRLLAYHDLTLGGGAVTTTGNVSVTATTGSILDGNTTANDITASGLRLWAGVGIGTGADPIETTVGTVSARATSGGIFLLEADNLIVGDTSATVNVVQTNGTTTATTDTLQSDIATTAGNGNIVLRTTSGSITLNEGTATVGANGTWGPLDYADSAISANGSGNILIAAQGTGTNLDGSITNTTNSDILVATTADIISGSGNITLLASDGVKFAANADIRTTSTSSTTGSIDVEAGKADGTAGSITMDPTSLFTTTGADGDIRLTADENVVVGDITTLTGDVSIIATSGNITDADALVDGANDSNLNITASGLRLWAGTGMGASNPIETTAGTVSASATSGGISLLETDNLIVGSTSATVNVVQTNGTVTGGSITDATQSNLTTTTGAVNLVAAGTIGLGRIVSTSGAVNVTATSGTITNNTLPGAGNIVTTGVMTLVARDGIGSASNVVTVNAVDLNASTTGTNMYLNDIAGGVAVGLITTGSTTSGEVNLTATSGNITESGSDAAADIVGNTLNLVVTGAASTIGAAANTLEIDAAILNAQSAGGNLYLNDTSGGVALGLVTTGSTTTGEVNLTATNGSMTESGDDAAADVVGNTLNLVVTGAGSTIGAANMLEIDTAVLNAQSDGGNISLNDIAGGVAVGLVTTGSTSSGEVNLTATSGTITESGTDAGAEIVGNTVNLVVTGAGNTIGTAVNTLEIDAAALNAQSDGGNLYLNDIAGGVALGLITTGSTALGEINLTATDGSITESGDDAAADVVGNTLNLVATGAGSTIGATANTLEIDTAILNAQSGGGTISLNDTAGGVTLGLVTTGSTTSGEVSLTATNGSITESGDDAGAEIIGNTINLMVTGAGSTIGTAANTLEIDSAVLNAQSDGGNMYLNDIAGGVALGLVTTGGTTSGEVNLMATDGSITELGDDAAADVIGNTINLVVTGGGSIGTAGNVLEIDAAVLNAQSAGGGIYLHDIAGGVAIGLIDAGGTGGGDVTLTATDGSITESGNDSSPDIVGKSVNIVIDGTSGSGLGTFQNMLEISSINTYLDNPNGNTYIDLNNGAASGYGDQSAYGMMYNNANLPEVIVYGNKIQGGDKIEKLLAAQSSITSYQSPTMMPVAPRNLILVSAERLGLGTLTLNNNVIF